MVDRLLKDRNSSKNSLARFNFILGNNKETEDKLEALDQCISSLITGLLAFSFSSWTCCFRYSMIWSASAARCSSLNKGLWLLILNKERAKNLPEEGKLSMSKMCSCSRSLRTVSRGGNQKTDSRFYSFIQNVCLNVVKKKTFHLHIIN